MNERREATRNRVYLGGRIVHRYLRSDTSCLLRNLSPSGARIVVGATTPLPDRFDVVIDRCGSTRSVETVWRAGDQMGVRFVTHDIDGSHGGVFGDGLASSRAELARLRARIAEIDFHAPSVEAVLH